MKLNDAVIGAILVLIGIVVLFAVRTFPTLPGQAYYGPGTFPGIIAIVMIAGGAVLVTTGIKSRAPALVLADWVHTPGAWGRMLAVIAFIVLYIFTSKPIGFPIVVPVLLTALLITMKVRPFRALLIALVTTAAFWFLFARLLLVPLPLGLLTDVIY